MPDKHEVGGSSPLGPTSEGDLTREIKVLIENRIKKETKQIVVKEKNLL